MQAQQALAFVLFALVAAGTPGPSNVLIMAAAGAAGWLAGLRCLAGVVAGMTLLIGVGAFGLGALLQALPGLLQALRVAGSLFLLWLAWKIGSATAGTACAHAAPAGFTGAFLLQWVNPKSWVVAASAAASFSAPAGQPAAIHAVQLGGLFAAAALPACAVWLASGALLQPWLRHPGRARAFHLAMGLLLAASVALLWT